MKTLTWQSIQIFDGTIGIDRIKLVDSPLVLPQGVEDAVRKNWDMQLLIKQQELSLKGIQTTLHPYHLGSPDQQLNALYEGITEKMWPGPVVSLKSIHETDRGIELLVGQTSFPFIAGIKDESITRLYIEQGIEIPRPALAVCTYALTTDNKLVLTVRGSRTNMYPGRLYGQGGNPLFTKTDLVQHQQSEMAEEILVEPNEYKSQSTRFLGLAEDCEKLPRKPDLVGFVPVFLDSETINSRVNNRKMEERPNDAVDVAFAPTTEGGLFDYLANLTKAQDFCPPAHGGLALYGMHRFGTEWSKRLLVELEKK